MNDLLLASFGEVMSFIAYVLIAILVLLVMITAHELGHYLAGKIFKFKIDEFAIGFGPKIFKKTKKDGEVFSVRLLPLGGFCSFHGEDSDDVNPSSFNNKKPWQRLIVLVSGAIMNYLLALILIALMFSVYGQQTFRVEKVDDVGQFSAETSFLERDVILSVEGKTIYLETDLMNAIKNKKQGDKVKVKLIRQGEKVEKEIILRCDTNFKNLEDTKTLHTALGIYEERSEEGELTKVGLRYVSVRLPFFTLIGRTFEYSFKLAGTVLGVLGQLITGRIGISSMGGTVTTIATTAKAVQGGGLWSLLYISSFIGVNLAVFNLLPIPALDGSRAVFTIIEWIRKKPISRKVEAVIHTVGLILILCFAVLIDLQRCF